MIGNGSITCHFLTPQGWIGYDDPTAIHDREAWPTGTALAGVLVTTNFPGQARPETRWQPHWCDPDATPETWEALAEEYGLSPAPAAVAA